MPIELPPQDAFRMLRMKILATGETTNGAFGLVEDVRGRGEGPALHIYKRSDEGFYVLDGVFTFTRGEEEINAGPGSFVLIQRGTEHRYQAQSAGSRVLILYALAAGFSEFLLELDHLLGTGLSSREAIATLEGKYDSDPARASAPTPNG